MDFSKLKALHTLAKAYHYLLQQSGPNEATHIIENCFGYIRRSLRLEDLAPSQEGFNGRGPKFF